MTEATDLPSVGMALVAGLRDRGVEVVFGIPGVHTIELYRGLPGSGIRHVTPRHEQAAGFMADGYARVSGKPGVAFVITGPGVANVLTPMGQARADSIPILIVSGVNARATLGLGMGHLHELPDQRAMMATVALSAERLDEAGTLGPALDRAFARMTTGRPGPVHIEVPTDVMPLHCAALLAPAPPPAAPMPDPAALERAAAMLNAARSPLILVGGGAKHAGATLRAVAERLGAPVVQTVNARGLLHAHPLGVPASPSLDAVRTLIAGADAVLAVGTEFGPTDYDFDLRGNLPAPPWMIRIDIDVAQLARHPAAVTIEADAAKALAALLPGLDQQGGDGPGRAAATRAAALAELGPAAASMIRLLDVIRDILPGSIIVGDSTQIVYAGNAMYDHDRPGGWFNAATGFGALGYGPAAAIGAAVAAPDVAVICLTGDGGLQFSLAELMTAMDEGVNVTFVVWNNRGYREIAEAMRRAQMPVTGCDPTPPDFAQIAAACGMPHTRIKQDPGALAAALGWSTSIPGAKMIEISVA